MKKLLTAALVAAATVSANAQYYVGGTVGFEYNKTKGAPASNTVNVMPEFGYKLDDKLSLGIEVGYSYSGNYSNELLGIDEKLKGNTFKIAPYARYTVWKTGVIILFLDGKVSFSSTGMKYDITEINDDGYPVSHTLKLNDNSNCFSVTVEPGIAFEVAKNVSIEAKTSNLLGFHHSWCGNAKNNAVGVGVNTLGLQLGAYYHF